MNTPRPRTAATHAIVWIADVELPVVAGFVLLSVASERFLPLAVIAALMFWVIRLFVRLQYPIHVRAELAQLVGPPRGFILLLLLMLLVTLWATAFPEITVPQVLRVITGIALYGAIVRWISCREHGEHRLHLLTSALLLTGLALALVTPFVIDWQGATKLSFIPASAYSIFRLWVTDSVNPNVMAGALVILLPIALTLLLFRIHQVESQSRWSFVMSVLLPSLSMLTMLVALVLMQSRSALLAFAVSALVVATLRWRRAWIPIVIFALVAIVFFIIRPNAADAVFSALTTGSAVQGADQRMEIWSRALYMVQDFSFTGVGMGAFQQVTDLLYPLILTPEEIPHAHNLLLQVAVDLGLPGLLAWLGIFITVIVFCWRSFKATRTSHRFIHALAAGLLGSQAALFVHGLTDAVTWGMVRSAPLVWALWGVGMATWILIRRCQTSS